MSRSSLNPLARLALPLGLGLLAPANLWSLPAAAAQEEPFTLEQVLSAPFPTSLTASPDGSRVAWVFDERGARNVWAAEAPDFRGRRLTSFDGDRGTTIGSLAFSRDGRRLAFIRGDGPNRDGELPNPTSDPAGVEQALWVIEDSEAPRQLTEPAASPLFTADGAAVLFLRRGRVFRIGVEAGAEAAQLIHGRGSFGNLRLSPDGGRLAFVSRRGAHSFVGIYDFAAETVHYLDPAVDRDGSPAFSPDGKAIAFVRTPPELRPYLFIPRREGPPWSIRVVQLDGEGGAPGAGREVFRALPGRGSVFSGTASADQLHWTDDGRILFPWERDGYRHFHAVSAAGGEPTALTAGRFEIEYAVPDGEGGLLLASNQDDVDRRHLWRLAPGSAAEALTAGAGVETLPVAVAGGVAYLGGDGRRPLQPMVRLAGGAPRPLAPDAFPADFPLDRLVEPEPVVFASADGMRIHGQLFRPAGGEGAPGPGVLFLHGGSRRQMLLGWHYMGYYSNCYAFHQYLASRGFTVLSVNYRSGTGYGTDFREALNYGASGAAEHQDVLGAGRFLADLPAVDEDRIGLWGGSYGGYLTAMGLSRASDLFAAGVDIHGVHDWNRTIQGFLPSYEPDHHEEQQRLAFESSPLASVAGWRSPVLLVHGDDDRNVPFDETVELVEKLRELGVEHELLIFPDEVHGFLRHENWLEVFRRSAAFFDRHLAR